MSQAKSDRLVRDLAKLVDEHGLDAVLLATDVVVLREIQTLRRRVEEAAHA